MRSFRIWKISVSTRATFYPAIREIQAKGKLDMDEIQNLTPSFRAAVASEI